MTSKKIFIAAIAMISVFSLVGCRSLESMQGTEKKGEEKAQSEDKKDVKDETISKLNTEKESYKSWILPESILQANKAGFKSSRYYDCVNIENANTLGGDVKSTLIADDGARKMMKLRAYTPKFIEELNDKVNKATEEKYEASVYAFKVCRLGNNVDVVAGYLWESDEEVDVEDGIVDKDFTENKVLAIVTKDKVSLYDDIQVVDMATEKDAKVMPCRASLKKDVVRWSCSQGKKVGNKNSMKSWEIPLAGGEIKTFDWVE